MYDCCIDMPILSIDRVVCQTVYAVAVKSDSSITEWFASARELQNATD